MGSVASDVELEMEPLRNQPDSSDYLTTSAILRRSGLSETRPDQQSLRGTATGGASHIMSVSENDGRGAVLDEYDDGGKGQREGYGKWGGEEEEEEEEDDFTLPPPASARQQLKAMLKRQWLFKVHSRTLCTAVTSWKSWRALLEIWILAGSGHLYQLSLLGGVKMCCRECANQAKGY
eukprot:jgi/Mesen1/247/ME1143357C07593